MQRKWIYGKTPCGESISCELFAQQTEAGTLENATRSSAMDGRIDEQWIASHR